MYLPSFLTKSASSTPRTWLLVPETEEAPPEPAGFGVEGGGAAAALGPYAGMQIPPPARAWARFRSSRAFMSRSALFRTSAATSLQWARGTSLTGCSAGVPPAPSGPRPPAQDNNATERDGTARAIVWRMG